MRVLRLDEHLIGMHWPEMVARETLVLGPADTLVMCAGFEDRAMEVLRRAIAAGSKNFGVLCVNYLPAIAENRSAEVQQLCSHVGAKCDMVTYNREEPAGAGERLLARVPQDHALYFDVSGMSRLLIVQLLAYAVRRCCLDRAILLYTEALHYPPTSDQVEEQLLDSAGPFGVTMFLSSGVFELTVVPELSSVAMQGQPIRVIAFPSWNATQMVALCAEIQASYYTIINGMPPSEENRWRMDAVRRLNRIEMLSACEEVTSSTLDYRETLKILLEVYREHAQRNKLVISPTGSKMQTVAVGLMCGWFRDLQIAYPTPRKFATPSEYTRGAKCVYALPLSTFKRPIGAAPFD
jgi:hypothetical protein